ncbi:MAG: hypothetical protein P8X70_01880, partial [Nanoarchaeota archaeon]
ESKKQELDILESQRKKYYTTKSELKSIKQRIEDKKSLFQNYVNESEFLLKQIKTLSKELFDKRTDINKLNILKVSLKEKREILEEINKKEKELEKTAYSDEQQIENEKELISNISKMDICPLCKSEITKEHIHSINEETSQKIEHLEKEIEKSDKKLTEIYNKREMLKQEIEKITLEISKRESDLIRISNINEKKEQIKELQENISRVKTEVSHLIKNKEKIEKVFDENSNIEQKCETLRIELQEISLRTKENVNSEISFKKRELERSKISLKQLLRDEEDIKSELTKTKKDLDENEKSLAKKKRQEEELSNKFKKSISERDALQKNIRDNELETSQKQNILYNIEQKINNFKIDRARIDAEIENLGNEMSNFKDVEVIKTNRESLVNRLNKIKELLLKIGSVNLRSLEVYNSIKKEYDEVNKKVETITNEKQGVLKIIHTIDVKKKKSFLKTLNELNEIFSRNFAQLSTKGQVSLEVENKKNPFEGGINIVVKIGHGKYFDVKSLSGGEQTLVALSLIFAIQELNPYSFYFLDEIDAALDKRNSARLANLLRKYMQKGQYLVITHNDEIITNATNLYGVSMHEGVSKILSLKV